MLGFSQLSDAGIKLIEKSQYFYFRGRSYAKMPKMAHDTDFGKTTGCILFKRQMSIEAYPNAH